MNATSTTAESGAVSTEDQTARWHDPKRYLWTLALSVPLFPLLAWGMAEWTGYGIFWFLPLVLLYGLIPALDVLVATDETNPPESLVKQIESDKFYRNLVFLYVPVYYAVFIWGAWMFMNGGLVWWEQIGLIIGIGVIGGTAINTAHELSHKTNNLERWLAKITLAPVFYGHFYVEHTRGHHKNVATPEDPASSRMGEGFYEFLPRTMIGSLKSAWALEKQRLARQDKGPWTWENDNIQAWTVSIVLWGTLVAWLGPMVLLLLIPQAFYGASLLEVVNFLEHYGLRRQKLESGRYERCQPEHSWNSNHVVTNLFLYQLQRHSDHHAHPTRRYQALRHFEEAPQLPSGYASMMLLAYVTPLWRKVMDPKVVAHYDGDLTKANLHPRKREALLRKYTPSALNDAEQPQHAQPA